MPEQIVFTPKFLAVKTTRNSVQYLVRAERFQNEIGNPCAQGGNSDFKISKGCDQNRIGKKTALSLLF